jgi:tyrosinase
VAILVLGNVLIIVFTQFVNWDETMRYPTNMNPNAATQEGALIQNVNSYQPQAQQRLYNVMTNMNNFSIFGTEAWIQGAGAGSYDSLESIHDQIHATVGGPNYGDMSVIALSAFDPAFWLHHA